MNRIISALYLVGLSIAVSTAAADDTFVGALALLDDPAVIQQLELPEETQAKIKALIDEREDASLELTLTIKGMPAADRDARLAEFRAESEKLGLALLTPAQQIRLKAAHVSQAGVQALVQPEIIAQLNLTALQQKYVTGLLDELQASTSQGTEAEQRAAKARIERSIVEILKPEQLAIWDRLTGRLAGPAEAAATTGTEPMSAPATGDAASEKSPPTNDPLGARPTGNSRAPSPAATTGTRRPNADGKVRFQFRYAPWKDVLEWFAEQADLSLVLDAPPQGTFNYSDSRSYTPAEAIDLLNGVLLTKGYTLVRRERMLMVVNLEDGVPPNLVPRIDVADLDAKGDFELVSVLFQLTKWTPEEAEAEVRKLIGPQGAVIVLPKPKQLLVTETGGKLRTIRAVIDAVENPVVPKDEKVSVIELKYVTPNGFMTVARPLIGLPEGVNATPDGTLRLSIDDVGNRLLATGKSERLTQLQDIVKLIDVPGPGGDEIDSGPVESPQLEVYRVTAADPASVLQIMQTLLAGLPDVRLTTDPKTGNLVALAKPSQHATIRATLEQLQRDASQVEVIKLRRLDPQAAVLAINKIFGGTAEGAASPNGPKVDADPATNNLLLRGNAAQIAQVKELLTKMGESGDGESLEAGPRSKMRVVPLSGRTMESALNQLEAIWPTLHVNKIRVIKPSASAAGIKTRGVPRDPEVKSPKTDKEKFDDNTDDLLNDLYPPMRSGTQSRDRGRTPNQSEPTRPTPAAPRSGDAKDKSTALSTRIYFVAQIDETAAKSAVAPLEDSPTSSPQLPATKPAAMQAEAADAEATPESAEEKEQSVPGAEVVVTVTPNGLIITSEDLDALDEFEEMLRTVTDGAATGGGREYTVFYLKYAKAEIAATLLTEAIGGGGASGAEEGGGGSLMGDLASSMLGDAGGGLLGGLLGGGGDSGGATASSGGVSIIPDPRLNALMVLAKARDIEMIEQLLQVIDQPASPESPQTIAAPRFIPVINSAAEEIATVVRQVYSGRIAGEAAQQRQPTPEDFVRALRGGGRGGRGGGGAAQQNRGEEQKMTVGVDARTNSLIVSAPDYLFEEVKLLVEELDTAETNSDETVRVVTLKRANADLIQRSISSVLGPTVTTNRTAASTTTQQPQNGRPGGQGGQRGQGGNAAEQQLQFFNNIQRAMGQGGGGGAGRGGRGGQGGGAQAGGGQGGGNRGGARTGR